MIGDTNARMARVFSGLALAFAAIIGLLTWWQVIAAPELRQKDYNNQTAWYERRIKRGLIRSADGVMLARNRAQRTSNGDLVYHRRYPQGSLAAHVVGYNTRSKNRTGVEKTHNDVLTGSTRALGTVIGKLTGNETIAGDSVQLTIRAKAQRVAERALAGNKGAIVALEPRTGRVLVMASAPTFDLGLVETRFGRIPKVDAPLLNRATSARYQPGSTFKVVTATAALEAGLADPDRSFPGGSQVRVSSGPPVSNFGGSDYGVHTFTYALTNSVNTTFARLGDELGTTVLRQQMRRFGFDSTPPLEDLPFGELRTSGLYGTGGKVLAYDIPTDSARVAIGQERLEVTPLQMAMVVAAVANEGVLMQPYLVEHVTSPKGRVVRTATQRQLRPVIDDEGTRSSSAMSAKTARQLTEMMQNVVREGTGTQAALAGIDVAGKTGTADTAAGNQVWFIAFAPADDPKVAIAVTLEAQPAGSFGGSVAAPIAANVIEVLLNG